MSDHELVMGVLPPSMKDLAQSILELIPALHRMTPQTMEDLMGPMAEYRLYRSASMDSGYVVSRLFKGINEVLGPDPEELSADPSLDMLMGLADCNFEFANMNESHFDVHPDCPARAVSEDFIKVHRAQAEIMMIMGTALRECGPHFQTLALRDLYDGVLDEEAPTE